ncbi:hypothetical protein NXS19_005703 [Fusarium pseudograminearum]|nr:hypothetical protein NXS19_005703 [Fusarium pseudograminearum]
MFNLSSTVQHKTRVAAPSTNARGILQTSCLLSSAGTERIDRCNFELRLPFAQSLQPESWPCWVNNSSDNLMNRNTRPDGTWLRGYGRRERAATRLV